MQHFIAIGQKHKKAISDLHPLQIDYCVLDLAFLYYHRYLFIFYHVFLAELYQYNFDSITFVDILNPQSIVLLDVPDQSKRRLQQSEIGYQKADKLRFGNLFLHND